MIIIAVACINNDKVNNPNNENYIETSQIPVIQKLKGTEFKVSFYRQSGNAYKDPVLIQPLTAAINAAVGTLNRAKITEVIVHENSEEIFVAERLFQSHSRSNNGQKVGKVIIERMLNTTQEATLTTAKEIEGSLNSHLALANDSSKPMDQRGNAITIAKQNYNDLLPILNEEKYIKTDDLDAVKQSLDSVEEELAAINNSKKV